MLGDLFEHQILIDGTFAKIDVVEYETNDDLESCETLAIEPVYTARLMRIWVDTSAIICIYEADNPNHSILYMSNNKFWEARYKRDAIANVIFEIKRGKYNPKKPGLLIRLWHYLFAR